MYSIGIGGAQVEGLGGTSQAHSSALSGNPKAVSYRRCYYTSLSLLKLEMVADTKDSQSRENELAYDLLLALLE